MKAGSAIRSSTNPEQELTSGVRSKAILWSQSVRCCVAQPGSHLLVCCKMRIPEWLHEGLKRDQSHARTGPRQQLMSGPKRFFGRPSAQLRENNRSQANAHNHQ
eukprot:Amastigsp_a844907_8.p1 type:complete len:104 gc:universal Amastigsp_a844907_8:425-114(-)